MLLTLKNKLETIFFLQKFMKDALLSGIWEWKLPAGKSGNKENWKHLQSSRAILTTKQ